ncbi:MAG TPA: hypothetical protein VGF77_18345 [Allosphingosinicella sp.]|jgi:hypothetical protein
MAKTYHFKVGNGDMSLVELETGRRILVDINIRGGADDEDDETPDVARQLKDALTRDDQGRLFVDAFLLTHPDKDHSSGLEKHFHLGPLTDWKKTDDKIVIREMWSSPMIFRRRSKKHNLCDDACAWSKEARRRVQLFRENGKLDNGDRILVLGEDVGGKTDDIEGILIKQGERFAAIDGIEEEVFEALLLAPRSPADDEEEDVLSKNNSSVILQMRLGAGGKEDAAYYLFGGDAEVAIWERLWNAHKDAPADLAYDVLIAPHHCSWHSLSWDSWSKLGEKAKVSDDARNALSQARAASVILASSCPIADDQNDPPCIRAKREYEGIVGEVKGEFKCVGEIEGDGPLVIEIGKNGPKLMRVTLAATAAAATGIGTEALAHG